MLKQKKPKPENVKKLLIHNAYERQKLGLSVAEYQNLTPFELECEIEALKIIEKEKSTFFEILDIHFARLQLLANGYNFPDVDNLDKLRILKSQTKKLNKKTTLKNTLKNLEMATKMKRLVEKIKANRDKIRKQRKATEGN